MKRKRISIFMATILCVVACWSLFSGFAKRETVEKTTYQVGDTIEIPVKTVPENAEVEYFYIAPNGDMRYLDEEVLWVTFEMSGRYTVRYFIHDNRYEENQILDYYYDVKP